MNSGRVVFRVFEATVGLGAAGKGHRCFGREEKRGTRGGAGVVYIIFV